MGDEQNGPCPKCRQTNWEATTTKKRYKVPGEREDTYMDRSVPVWRCRNCGYEWDR